MTSIAQWNNMLPTVRSMLNDGFSTRDLHVFRGPTGADVLVVHLTPSVKGNVVLDYRRATWLRPGNDTDTREIGAVLGSHSEGPLFPRFYPCNPITLTPAIYGSAARDLIGLAEARHRAGDTEARDAADDRVEELLDMLDEIETIEFPGYTNKWKEIVWRRTALLRGMHERMRAERA